MFQASTFNGSVENGIFKRLGHHGCTRAKNIMSTRSTSGFEWSVKLISSGSSCFEVGIASIFKLEDFASMHAVFNYDETAILYSADGGHTRIFSRKNKVHSNLPQHKTGDVIRFKFQPLTKKLIIELVRF